MYNRRYFNEKFLEDFKFAYREKLYVNFALIDIDHFKRINDKYGHIAGDYCLEELSKIFRKHFHRVTDKIYRYGGEEFVIYYLSKKTEKFKEKLEELRKDVEETEIFYENKIVKFTISIGAISKIPEDIDYIKFIKIADNNLYKAKETGRNKVVINKKETS
ncbi:GGDEF domain-containing protein [Marinitoga lauensis]|uniref:GGDEF domain-containing protein n=1 Tax=Marinitoga lauensis TaxID=2201189 RepID=UPI0014053A58|nr:GGDEF domain-containing protein [Marinitoga lauensis]